MQFLMHLANTRLPWFSLFLTIVLSSLLQYLSPNPSILNFEFAGSIEEAQRQISVWGDEGRLLAIRQTYLDFAFLLSYPLTLCLFILRVAQKQPEGLRQFGITLGALQPVAGLLDAVENLALLKTLHGSTSNLFPVIAYYGAAGKFLIVIGGIIFLIIGAILNIGLREK